MYYLLDRVVMNEHRLIDYHMNFQELTKYVLKRKPDIMTRLAVAEARFGQFCIDHRVDFVLDDGDDCRHYLVWNLKPKQAGLDGVPYEYTLHSDSGPTGSEPHYRSIEFYNTHGGDNDYNHGFIFSLLMQLPGMMFGAGEHQKELGEAVKKEGIISLISELVDLYTEFTQAVVAQKEQESADASEVLLRETLVPAPSSGNEPQGKNKNTAKQRRQCRKAKKLAAAQMQEMASDGVESSTNSELALCAIHVEPLQETISASTVPETAKFYSISDDSVVALADVSSAFTAMAPAVNAPNTNAAAPTHNDAATSRECVWKDQCVEGPTPSIDVLPQLSEGSAADEFAREYGGNESEAYVAEERRRSMEDDLVEESSGFGGRYVDKSLHNLSIAFGDSRLTEMDNATEKTVIPATVAEQDLADAAMENESGSTADHTFTDSCVLPPAHHGDALAALPALHVNPGLATTIPWTMKNTFLFEGHPREEWYMYDRRTLSRSGRSKSGDMLDFMLLDPGEPMYVTPMMGVICA
jgi:hypothetical protein